MTTGRLQNPSHLSWQLRLASCFMHVVQLFVVFPLYNVYFQVLPTTFRTTSNFSHPKQAIKSLLPWLGKVQSLKSSEIRSWQKRLNHQTIIFMSPLASSTPNSWIFRCQWQLVTDAEMWSSPNTSGTRKILKICSVHLLPLFRAISPEENSNTLRNALLTWRRAMANQMRHRGVSLIELCSGLKLKVAISCLLAYYVYLKSGDMWAFGGKAKPLQLHLQGYFQERATPQKNFSTTMAASPSTGQRTEPTTG